MFRIGSLRPGWITEAWCTEGRNPLPIMLMPPWGIPPPPVTTKPGKLLFSLPRPYVTQAPMLGKPANGSPQWK